MSKQKNNQSGFSVVEVLLVLIFVAIVVLIGVYVAHNHSNKTTASTTKTSTTSKKASASTTATPPATTKTTATTVPTQSYLAVTEWSVKIPVSGTLATAKYENITSAYGTKYDTVQVIVTPSAGDVVCKGGLVGWITRVPDSSPPDSSTVNSHVGSYYYEYDPGQDCTAPTSTGVMAQFKQAVGQIVAS
jgi:hypothetical protein